MSPSVRVFEQLTGVTLCCKLTELLKKRKFGSEAENIFHKLKTRDVLVKTEYISLSALNIVQSRNFRLLIANWKICIFRKLFQETIAMNVINQDV